MELYELGIGLPVLSIAALMELLDDTSSHTGKPIVPALPGRPVGTGQARPQGPARAVAGALGAAPGLRSTPWRRSCGSGTGSGRVDLGDHLLPHHQRRGAAGAGRRPQGPSVRPSRRASYAIGALCSAGAAIPLVGVALLAN